MNQKEDDMVCRTILSANLYKCYKYAGCSRARLNISKGKMQEEIPQHPPPPNTTPNKKKLNK